MKYALIGIGVQLAILTISAVIVAYMVYDLPRLLVALFVILSYAGVFALFLKEDE